MVSLDTRDDPIQEHQSALDTISDRECAVIAAIVIICGVAAILVAELGKRAGPPW